MSPADDRAAVAAAPPPFKPLPMRAPDVSVERRADGSILIRSNHLPREGPTSITQLLTERLAAFNRTAGGSSRRVGRFPVLKEPPSIDAGEITDKRYVNQRAAQACRHAQVDALYGKAPAAGVVEL